MIQADVLILHLQRRKMRFREIKWFIQVHSEVEQQSQNSSSGSDQKKKKDIKKEK